MNFKPFLAYSASAGSGKTFALAVRYISLLFMGESPSNILAATFTNKAAAEMRQRVLESLKHLGANDAFLNAVCEQTGMRREELFAKQPEVLSRFLSSTSHIVTLDSFFSSILRAASLEIGLEPDFVTKEEAHEKLEMHFLDTLEYEGKLGSLVRLALDIEDKRFTKIFDLMQTFYKADPLLPEPPEVFESIKTLEAKVEAARHALHEAVIASGASKTAINNFAPASAKVLFGKSVFAKPSLTEHNNYRKYIKTHPEIETGYQELKALLAEWGRLKETIVLQAVYDVYGYYKSAIVGNAAATGVLTFDDLTYFTYRLLHESVSREFIYFKIDAKFRHILLDEFQDTSTLQFLLLKPMIDEIFAGKGQGEFRSFFYVGDTKQSLYRFRGGVEELFDKVAERYEIDIEQMDTNYRSAKAVVEQVNRWFGPVMPGYVAQKSGPNAKEGYVEVVESEELLEEAVAQAKRLIDAGVRVDEIAFLVSTNKDGQALQEACGKEGIATLLKTSSSLKHLPKIAALAAMAAYLFYGERIDAEPLLQRVGKKIDEIDTAWFHPFMSPLQVLDRLVREFGYFDEDPNILKLLEFASVFSDIPSFLEEFETSSIAIASHSVHGANIMTIHGSKGLEFPYVIVMDKLTKPSNDTAPLIFHYNDALYIDKILYRTKGREHFDERYAKIMEERKVSSHKDRLNVLYVALTRAVEGLLVLKKPEGSIFDLLQIEPLVRGVLNIVSESSEEENVCVTEALPKEVSFYGRLEVKGEEDEERDLAAIHFGIALHYGLEMMGSFDAASLDAAMVAVENRYGQRVGSEGLEEIRRRIEMLIAYEPFMKLLEDAKISKEQALSYNGELRQVDLLLDYGERAAVVDYKSSRQYSFKHREQVAWYVKAIGSLLQKPTAGVLVYLEKEGISLISLK